MFTGGGAKHGFLVSSHATKAGRPVQDSAKEDFLLCPRCEARLEKLETWVANKFYTRFRNPAFRADFPITTYQLMHNDQPDTMHPVKVPTGLLRLFVYSMFWRASIASVVGYENFLLEPSVTESLRAFLDTYLSDDAAETLKNAHDISATVPIFPYNFLTSIIKTDDQTNFVSAPFSAGDGRYLMPVNEFMIILYTESPLPYGPGYNTTDAHAEIAMMSTKAWQEFMAKMVSMLVDARIKARGFEGLGSL